MGRHLMSARSEHAHGASAQAQGPQPPEPVPGGAHTGCGTPGLCAQAAHAALLSLQEVFPGGCPHARALPRVPGGVVAYGHSIGQCPPGLLGCGVFSSI